jgi:hypothetical protein
MENNHSIFKLLNINNNDTLSKLHGNDIQNIIYFLNKYYLELRTNLNLKSEDTFGLELEFEHSNNLKISEELNNAWILKSDASLEDGGEVNSPILSDQKSVWTNLKNTCTIIKEYSKPGEKAAGHIHVGAQVLGNNYSNWLNFIKLWSTYENVLFRFGYNEYLTERPQITKYAGPISHELWLSAGNIEYDNYVKESFPFRFCYLKDLLPYARPQAVNFINISDPSLMKLKNTIEFRNFNETLNPIIWQNNVNLLVKLLNYCCRDSFDLDIIENRHKMNEEIYNSINLYREIYLNEALELADLIFDNNLDKVYFLKQYLKNYEVGYKPLTLAKKITID